MRGIAFAKLFPPFMFACCGWGASAEQVTACEISRHPQLYANNNLIAVPAVLVDNTLDVLYLFDPTCPKSGVDLQVTRDVAKHAQLEPFFEILKANMTEHKRITATFIGTIEHAPRGS